MTVRKFLQMVTEFNIPLNTEVFIEAKNGIITRTGGTEIELTKLDNGANYLIIKQRQEQLLREDLDDVAKSAVKDDITDLGNFLNDMERAVENCVERHECADECCEEEDLPSKEVMEHKELMSKAMLILACSTTNDHTQEEVSKHIASAIEVLGKGISA